MFTAPAPSTPAPASASSVPPVVERLARHIKCEPKQLLAVSGVTLGIAVGEMQLDAADRAAIDIWRSGLTGHEGAAHPSATPDATSILANEVRRQTDSKMFPWASQEEAVKRLINTYADEYSRDETAAWEGLRSAFVSKAKIGSLGHVENLVGQYILYAPDKPYASYLLMSLLLRAPAAKRVNIHNWLVAQDMTRSQVESFGEAIGSLRCPLFPVTASLGSLNQQTLEAQLQKGSDVPVAGSALTMEPAGAGTLPVSLLPDGSYGVDVTVVEQACHDLQQQINVLHQQKRALRSRLTPQQQQPQPRLYPQHQQQYHQQQQQQQQQKQQQQQRQNRRIRGGNHTDPTQIDLDDLFATPTPTPQTLPTDNTPKTVVAPRTGPGPIDLGFLGVRR